MIGAECMIGAIKESFIESMIGAVGSFPHLPQAVAASRFVAAVCSESAHTHARARSHTHTHAYKHVRARACTQTHKHTHAKYTHTHTHTHEQLISGVDTQSVTCAVTLRGDCVI